MNLDYNILWIDDRPRQVEDAVEHIKLKLARKGFHLNVVMVQEVENNRVLQKKFSDNDFDLLVVDYKLQQNRKDGSELIRDLRRFSDSTDIVFYSSETPSELRRKIDSDGVYCANRSHLSEKLDHVIHSTIKKVLDLNSMRGISLAQLADFDHLIDEIISTSFKKLRDDESREKIIKEICEKASTYHIRSNAAIEKIEKNQEIEKYLNLLSSNPKHELLLSIVKFFEDEDLELCINRITNYTEEIITPRNKLAHAMQKSFKSGSYVLQNKSKEILFNSDDFTSIRLKLIEYREQFCQIKNIIDRI